MSKFPFTLWSGHFLTSKLRVLEKSYWSKMCLEWDILIPSWRVFRLDKWLATFYQLCLEYVNYFIYPLVGKWNNLHTLGRWGIPLFVLTSYASKIWMFFIKYQMLPRRNCTFGILWKYLKDQYLSDQFLFFCKIMKNNKILWLIFLYWSEEAKFWNNELNTNCTWTINTKMLFYGPSPKSAPLMGYFPFPG
jgi:hypothetical protein